MAEKNDDEKICECCGAKLVEYKHGMSKSLAESLVVFERSIHNALTKARILRGSGLNHSQACNFQKLKYWGLVDKISGKDYRSGEAGRWYITKKGYQFLMGAIEIKKNAITYRGKVVAFEGADIDITKASGGWKYRDEYAKEAEPHVGDADDNEIRGEGFPDVADSQTEENSEKDLQE